MTQTALTREQVLAMEPGRELDSHVALAVMGIEQVTIVGKYRFIDSLDTPLPNYSTDISAAWEVVEKMSRGKVDRSFVLEFHFERYYAAFGQVPFKTDVLFEFAPEAITKAALLAVLDI